ncbi:MAG: hypothetical protein GY832_17150, partial [Chloroflexi bacterium]|nr:hypothetical protein [Chloroflexota bacterium]
MNVKRWHIPLIPIIVTVALINSIAPPAPTQRQVASVHAAAPPPPRELYIEHFPESETGPVASPHQSEGLFPYYGTTVQATWGGTNLLPQTGEDRNLYFTTEITYPAPEEGIEYTGDLTWDSTYVTSCTHDTEQRRITCTGSFPPSDPVQWLETWVSFHIQGTCDLYPDPPDQVTVQVTVNWSDNETSEETADIPIQEPVDMTVISDMPTNNATNVFIESNHQGPLFQWHDQTAGYTCGDGTDPINQDVLYAVTIQKQDGQERRIGDENGECARQIQLSEDDLSCLESGDPVNWQWTITAVDIKYSPCVDPFLSQDNEFGFSTASCKPEVSNINPHYGNQYFLQNISVPNRYRVEVDWNGDAYQSPADAPYGKVHFEINGTENPANGVDGQQWGVEHPLNMGNDFQASFTGGDNDLKIWATHRPSWASEDLDSEETHVQPMIYPLPEWITQLALGNFTINLQEATVSYGRGLQYPDPAFEAQYRVPTVVPYLGGADVGIVETAAEIDFEVCSDGTGEVGLAGRTGVQVTEQNQVSGGIEGRGQVRLGNPEGLDLTSATFGLNVAGEISKEMGVADLVPAIKAAENWWIVGRIVKWFNQRANVTAALGPEINIETTFRDVNDELEFESGTGTGLIDMTLTLTLEILESLRASIFGGARPSVTVQVPASGPYGYLREIAIRFRAGVNIVAWIFDETWERGVTCGLPGGCRTDSGMSKLLDILAAEPTWELIERDYLGPEYAVFVANEQPKRSSDQLTAEMAISQNVFPMSNPALAIRDDGLQMMLWGYDDPAQPITQSLEIHASYLSGSTWISDTVTDDNLLDFSPQVAFDAEGDAVAIWERINTAHISPTLNITFVRSLEIASAQWLSDTQSWTNVVTLTQASQGLMDTAPQLVRGQADGTLLSTWRTSDGYELVGTITHPLTITYALWDGDNWSTPAAALSGLTGTIDVNVAVYS